MVLLHWQCSVIRQSITNSRQYLIIIIIRNQQLFNFTYLWISGSHTHSLYAATAQKYFPVLHENNHAHPGYGGHDGRFRTESFFIIVLNSAVDLFFHSDHKEWLHEKTQNERSKKTAYANVQHPLLPFRIWYSHLTSYRFRDSNLKAQFCRKACSDSSEKCAFSHRDFLPSFLFPA